MNWLTRLLRRAPVLDARHIAALDAYRSREKPDPRSPLAGQRLVVVDVEASGLDPTSDRLISVGAVAVQGGLARLHESFETVLRQDEASGDRNILVHGIGGSAQLQGRDPASSLVDFLGFAGKAPLVAFHADFDRILIERTAAATLRMKPDNAWLDLALLTPALFPDHGHTVRALDDWLQLFGIQNHDRHDALADALATAQLLLVVLAVAGRQGLATWADLARVQRNRRWLGAPGRYV
ncbi:MAG: 3'-5' exonuclease [Burkholderiales bacterium]